ncbi:MAG: MGMT family protein [Verrucomicrobia bacterium]|nr:MGMT family protein [Verrucomicrobiota bacterium]
MNDMNTTYFQQTVYNAIRSVPRGRVTTYALVGEAIGCRSPRAVGQALRRNPFAPKVPCHRVIASDLTPGGFNGARGGTEIIRKLRLLASEGVEFHAGRLADPSRVVRLSVGT